MNRRAFITKGAKALGLALVAPGTLIDLAAPPEDKKPKPSKLAFESMNPDRLDREPERIYAELWEQYNNREARYHGVTLLEWLMAKPIPGTKGFFGGPDYEFREVTQDMADAVQTVIQWLGTSVGGGFKFEAERKIKAHWDAESAKRFADIQVANR